MRVLWFVNAPMPGHMAMVGRRMETTGWWMVSLLKELMRYRHFQFIVVCESGIFNQYCEEVHDNVTYVGIPEQNIFRRLAANQNGVSIIVARLLLIGAAFTAAACLKGRNNYVDIIRRYEPDLVHVHGTEKPYALAKQLCPDVPFLVTIQGILDVYRQYYWADLPWRERLKYPQLMADYLGMQRYSVIEREIFRCNQNFGGRTFWDRAHVLRMNSQACYFNIGEMLREDFIGSRWRSSNAVKGRIYTTTTPRTYKGIHILIEAIAILRMTMPNIHLRIGGPIGKHGWSRRMRRLAASRGLSDCVEFLGYVDTSQIVENLQECQVYVLPSFIENSPNSLAEAQAMGVPCVSSYCGGVPSMIEEGETGLLFNCGDSAVLAEKIRTLMNDEQLATRLSMCGRKVAHARHESSGVVSGLRFAYSELTGL
ncbi:glycosyltransferase family 4 protein [Cerasicoccus fimbriatus]|uniref:glycosyltransferase family 4 protein n=1 Tax=Cerasicoccus fimbriatus TaxID=3014554 RepID=UPI0022B3DE06|nr:glycosyltransferase family 4 protein [Cerasicoccus sp. TK19100]